MSYTIMMRPYYNECFQTYQNILTINVIPAGALSKWVRPIRFSRTSVGWGGGGWGGGGGGGCCQLGILRGWGGCRGECRGGEWATPEDIPNLFLFLTQNGYKIDTSLTKMMNTSNIQIANNQQIVCFFS